MKHELRRRKSDLVSHISDIVLSMSDIKSVIFMLAVIASVLLSAAPAIAHTGCNTPRHFSDSTRTTSLSPADKVTADDIIREAKKYIGCPYRSGSSSPRGFDCSGFTSYVFRQLGIQLGRSSRDQIHDGTNVKKSELRKGDLVFFTGSRNRRTIGHVGIVTEVMDDGDFRFIHAARKGIVIDGFKSSAYYTKRYVGARRIVEE